MAALFNWLSIVASIIGIMGLIIRVELKLEEMSRHIHVIIKNQKNEIQNQRLILTALGKPPMGFEPPEMNGES